MGVRRGTQGQGGGCEDSSQPPELKDGDQLRLVDWSLTSLPTWLDSQYAAKHAPHVRTLALKGNLFTSVPDVRLLHSMKELNLSGNEICELNATDRLPPSLTRLDAMDNKLTSVDGSLLSILPNLHRLDLNGNHLSTSGLEAMCAALVSRKSLKVLDLSCNHLT